MHVRLHREPIRIGYLPHKTAPAKHARKRESRRSVDKAVHTQQIETRIFLKVEIRLYLLCRKLMLISEIKIPTRPNKGNKVRLGINLASRKIYIIATIHARVTSCTKQRKHQKIKK